LGRGEPDVIRVTPLPPEAAPVDYGATLAEWEEATQGEVEQAESKVPTSTTAAVVADDGGVTDLGVAVAFEDIVYREIMWDGLLPPDFTPEALMAKFNDRLADVQDGSPEAQLIYAEMQEELNNAPVNQALDETLVRLPGFIAPLDYSGEEITEFLLVPYFGACIHVPPPPVNQTVLVQTAEGHGIKVEDSFAPIWVMGTLKVEESETALASAGYAIEGALIEPYDSALPQ
jgi:hypothetical protein